MPRWDYKCETCRSVREHEFPINDVPAIVECFWCKGVAQKQPSAPNFVVTGYSASNGYSKG